MRRDLHTHTQHKRDRLDQSQTAAVLYSTAHSREPKRGNVYKPYMCVYICCEKTPLVLFYLFEECARFINIFLLIVIISIEYYLTSYRLMLWFLPGRSLTRRLANEPQLRIQNGQYQEDQDSH
jgi:hypothetical protein